MAQYHRNEVISGFFICLAILAFALFAFRVGGFDFGGLLKGDALVCRSYFTSIRDLAVGSDVVLGGRPVGRVTATRVVERPLSEEQARLLARSRDEAARLTGKLRQIIEVEFELHDSDLRIHPETAFVALRAPSILAPHILVIHTGEWPRNEAPGSILEGDLAGFEIAAREEPGLNQLAVSVEVVLAEVEKTLRTVNESFLTEHTAAEFDGLLTQLSEASKRMNERFLDDDMSDRLRGALDSASAAIANIEEVTGRMNALLDAEQDPRIHTVIDDMGTAVTSLNRELNAMGETRRELGELLEQVNTMVAENRPGVAQSVHRLSEAMWHAELALRKIRSDPSVLVFGDKETDFEAHPMDEGKARHSGRVRPYGQRDEDPDR